MNILITGGAGYIGSHAAHQFIKADHQVFVIDNLTTGFKEAVPVASEFFQIDVKNTDHVEQILINKKIDCVIHFAAKLIVPESVEKPLDYFDNNVGGMISLLRACEKALVKKIVFSSTAAVYGNPELSGLIHEGFPTKPINPYGHSKLMAEQILHDYQVAHPDFRFVILRYFNVAGSSDDLQNGQRSLNATHLIKVASQVATGKRESMQIFGSDFETADGTGVRDYIHVEDLAAAHVLAANYLNQSQTGKPQPSCVLNAGYGQGYSVLEVIRAVEKSSGQKILAEKTGRRSGDPATLVANSDQLKKILGWKPQRQNLDLICKSAYDWELNLKC